ncbi:bud emergence protein 1 [Coelomomyces lativittatus]|nr:bud emergence protein 1 [Coelomomyces lativittatus]
MNESTEIFADVLFEFNATRPDELSAKKGDVILIKAYYKSDWLVARSITAPRLTGIIPSSYVSVRNFNSKDAVSDLISFFKLNKIPTLEEWRLQQRQRRSQTKNEASSSNTTGESNITNSKDQIHAENQGKKNSQINNALQNVSNAKSSENLNPVLTPNTAESGSRMNHLYSDISSETEIGKEKFINAPQQNSNFKNEIQTPHEVFRSPQDFSITADSNGTEIIYTIYSTFPNDEQYKVKKVFNDFYSLKTKLISITSSASESRSLENLEKAMQLKEQSTSSMESSERDLSNFLKQLKGIPTIAKSPYFINFFKSNGKSFENQDPKIKLKIKYRDFPPLKIACDPYRTTLKSIMKKIQKEFSNEINGQPKLFVEMHGKLPSEEIHSDEQFTSLLLKNNKIIILLK